MYKRFVILAAIILLALTVLAAIGYQSVEIRKQGAEGRRIGEFAEVAQQIRQDVQRKLDDFLQREQNRPYTHYQYYYVPDNIAANVDAASNAVTLSNDALPLLRSPLASSIHNEFAYGNFQVASNGAITTPYGNDESVAAASDAHVSNIRHNLLPAITDSGRKLGFAAQRFGAEEESYVPQPVPEDKAQSKKAPLTKGRESRRGEYEVQPTQQTTQVYSQERSVASYSRAQAEQVAPSFRQHSSLSDGYSSKDDRRQQVQSDLAEPSESLGAQPASTAEAADEIVQVRVEPFVPVVVGGADSDVGLFGGQVFFLRHVQVEDSHFVQGFKLDEERLLQEVRESASRFVRKGMGFDIARRENGDSAYTAILNFGFGDLVLNLRELDPLWLARQLSYLRNWYFSIIGVVCLATLVALGSLWRNMRAQVKLARKKDDFISAVSHELRTPLTSIRMYSEMLEKNWVKSPDKAAEYYTGMRQESERLSRLVENVLDFSRIQRGRKKYSFNAGDINACVANVIDMMTPYAAQHGFTIRRDFDNIGEAAFDNDAVAQIVVNLVDNAVKYARNAADKTITVRTRADREFVYIEVEDHGPGIPHSQRKKVFEQFYRCGSEATRETAGTGLGLALVQKFAQAHNGFVKILAADPTGAILRVGLPLHTA